MVRKYREYLTHSANLTLLTLDPTIADYAVDFRAKYALKTPDAIQLGTAVATGADFLVTNDPTWKRIQEVDVVVVSEL